MEMKMKKLVILAVAALLAVPGFAQVEPVYTSSDGKATFDMFGHLGFGYHITKSNDFKPSWCDEFFVNDGKLRLRTRCGPAGQRLQLPGEGVRSA